MGVDGDGLVRGDYSASRERDALYGWARTGLDPTLVLPMRFVFALALGAACRSVGLGLPVLM